MCYILVIIFAYILGSSSMSFYLSKLYKVNMKGRGSKNLGASNAMLLMGWKAGIIVGIHDIGKAALSVLLAEWLFPRLTYAGAVAGVACILGHIFPFYLKFDGGKGFAAFWGMLLALRWKYAVGLFVVVLLIVLISNYLVCGTMATVIITPIYFGIAEQNYIMSGIIMIATAVIILKHRENLARIYRGEELKFLSALHGEHKGKL